MATALTYVFFIIGLILIIKGGDIFVDGATKVANILGVPKFIIGATIVSIATTLPEIIVSIQATLSKNVDMAVGNAIGSVTANTALILGLFITFMPFEIKRKDISFKSIAMIFAVVFIIIGCIVTQKKELSFKGEVGEYYFLSALGVTLLFTVFAIFIFENIKCIKSETKSDESKISYCTKEKVSCIILFILGAVGIIFGARICHTNCHKPKYFAKSNKRYRSCYRHFPAGACNSSYSTKEKIRLTFSRKYTWCKYN